MYLLNTIRTRETGQGSVSTAKVLPNGSTLGNAIRNPKMEGGIYPPPIGV
jgi:hypothetical protein